LFSVLKIFTKIETKYKFKGIKRIFFLLKIN
jgi:hypothetical protein